MSPKDRVLLTAGILIMAFGITAVLFGQATYGSIIGTLTDPSGDVMPGTQVKAVNTGTNVSSTAQTNSSGNYELTQLLPGT